MSKKILFLMIVFVLAACSPKEEPYEHAAEVDEFYQLYQNHEQIPLLTQSDAEFSYDDAYTFQEEFAEEFEENGEELYGYKLGLTGEQRPFGATEAVYGRLFDSMVHDEATAVDLSDFVKAMVEVEIAYTFDEDVEYPLTAEELQAAVATVAPAIELPDLMFADMKNLSWLDLIAIDVAPRQIIVGTAVPVEDVDVNAIATTAMFNGEIINEGASANVMGDQWAALLFLAEKLNERGYQIKAGDTVITGAMSGMFPVEIGEYEIDYGTLGTIAFEAQE